MIEDVLLYRAASKLNRSRALPDLMNQAAPEPDRRLPVYPCVYAKFKGRMAVLMYDPEKNSLTEVRG